MNKKELIMIVEDNRGDAFLAETLLKCSDYSTITAATLSEAISTYKSMRPVLVLLDLGLPDSFGEETFTRFLEACPRANIIIWSGISDEGTARRLLQLGAADYVVKTYLCFGSGNEVLLKCRNTIQCRESA